MDNPCLCSVTVLAGECWPRWAQHLMDTHLDALECDAPLVVRKDLNSGELTS